MRRAWIASALLLVGACTEPEPLVCDGGRVVREDGEDPRCAYDDPTDASVDGSLPGDAGPGDGGGDARIAIRGDLPDCMDPFECPRVDWGVLDLTASSEASLTERIDGEDHAIPIRCETGATTVTTSDRDVVRIEAPARSIVEVVVEPDEGSELQPVVETYDDGMRFLTFAGGAARAQTRFVQHAPPPGAVSVLIQHVDSYGEDECDDAPTPFRGGDDHGYTVTARICESCAIEDLGTLDAPTDVTARLDERGDVHVVRFAVGSSTPPSAEVGPSDTTCPASLEDACCPILVPLDPGPEDRPRALYSDTTRAVPAMCSADLQELSETNATRERLLAIYDYNGLGAEGYETVVTITP